MLIVFVLYLVILMVITIYTARMSKSSLDFISGGRKIGGISLALSERATGESAWLIIGHTGEAFLIGMQAIWFAVGCVVWYWFFVWSGIVASPFLEKSFTVRCHCITDIGHSEYYNPERIV